MSTVCICLLVTQPSQRGGGKVKLNSATPWMDTCMGAYLPVFGRWARRWINYGVCDAWPVQRQTYGYLPSLCQYQIYTAWWQTADQDINPIVYAVTHLNTLDLTSCTGPGSNPGRYADQASEHVFSLMVAHATAMLSRQPRRMALKILLLPRSQWWLGNELT